jgi:hypothetical protein
LGLCEVDLERIQYDYKHDLVKQTQQVLYEWRNDTTVKATLGVLGQALDNVGIGTMCLKRVVEHIGVEKLYNSRQQSNQPPSERTWGTLVLRSTDSAGSCKTIFHTIMTVPSNVLEIIETH